MRLRRTDFVGMSGQVAQNGVSSREPRVDVLRGFALLCIFVDHIPGDDLNTLTPRNFGFSDAAELFVMLAGFASMTAYGRSFDRDGARAGLRRIAQRCLRLYVFQIGLLLATLMIVWSWTTHFRLTPLDLAPMLAGGVPSIVRGLLLQAQPSNLNILPLYIVLLAIFPILYAGMRVSPVLALSTSGLLWIATNLDPNLNFIDPVDGNHWFFNPFAWQFLFALGAGMSVVMRRNGGSLPRHPVLIWLSATMLLAGFLETFPWRDWHLPNLTPIAMDPPDKTNLSPLRLVHALAVVYLVLIWSGLRKALTWRPVAWLEACGRHSLEVFSLGTLLDVCAGLGLRTYGFTEQMQLAVNVIGLGSMIALALWLEHGRTRQAISRVPLARS
jgi:hypothetical protein